jgi:hypothetical protein
LYDQTRRTPIVIPVINEIGGGGQQNREQRENRAPRPQDTAGANTYRIDRGVDAEAQAAGPIPALAPKKFPEPQHPDTPETEPKVKTDARSY